MLQLITSYSFFEFAFKITKINNLENNVCILIKLNCMYKFVSILYAIYK